MRKAYSIAIVLLIVVGIFCPEGYSKPQQSAKRLLRNAYYYYDYLNYGYALPFFEQYVAQDSSSPRINFDAAECYYFAKRDYVVAAPLYESVKNENPLAYKRLAEIYHSFANFNKARDAIEAYLKFQDGDTLAFDWAFKKRGQLDRAEYAMAHPIDAEIHPLPDSINSEYPDYVPIVTPEGQFMFFTSRKPESTGGLTDPNGDYFEDIYMSENVNGFWSKPVNLGRPVNSDTHDACLGITTDMQTMFLYRTNDEGTGGNIYESYLKNGRWGRPKLIEASFNLKCPDVKVISMTVAPDSVTYYYVSNEPGGYGGTDIYKVVRFGPNFWSRPQNLGPNINTPEDEDSPFIHYDGKTMYFSSKGHDSYGSYDVFVSEMQDDGNWGVPKNIGYPISTVADDRSFIKMPDGQTCYFSSKNRENGNSQDIYVAYMPRREVSYATVFGLAKDQYENPVKCELKVLHADTRKVVGIYRPNLLTGRFVMLLPPSGKYEIEVLVDKKVVDEIEFDVPKELSMIIDQLTIIIHSKN